MFGNALGNSIVQGLASQQQYRTNMEKFQEAVGDSFARINEQGAQRSLDQTFKAIDQSNDGLLASQVFGSTYQGKDYNQQNRQSTLDNYYADSVSYYNGTVDAINQGIAAGNKVRDTLAMQVAMTKRRFQIGDNYARMDRAAYEYAFNRGIAGGIVDMNDETTRRMWAMNQKDDFAEAVRTGVSIAGDIGSLFIGGGLIGAGAKLAFGSFNATTKLGKFGRFVAGYSVAEIGLDVARAGITGQSTDYVASGFDTAFNTVNAFDRVGGLLRSGVDIRAGFAFEHQQSKIEYKAVTGTDFILSTTFKTNQEKILLENGQRINASFRNAIDHDGNVTRDLIGEFDQAKFPVLGGDFTFGTRVNLTGDIANPRLSANYKVNLLNPKVNKVIDKVFGPTDISFAVEIRR